MHTGHFLPTTTSTQTSSKPPREKRKDRKTFSRLGPNKSAGGSMKIRKDQGEAGRRYDQSQRLAEQQRHLLQINPSLPETAFQGKGLKPGWTPLKSNNRSKDVQEDDDGQQLDPFAFNKDNLLSSSLYGLIDSTNLIDNAVQELQAIETGAAALMHHGASVDKLRDFISKISQSASARRLAEASGQRGSIGFCPPFSLHSQSYPRL